MAEEESAADRFIREHAERKAALKARQDAAPIPPSVRSLCLDHTLYATIQLNPERDIKFLGQLKTGGISFDAHCVFCEQATTFRALDREVPEDPFRKAIMQNSLREKAQKETERLILQGGQFAIHLNCLRRPDHLYSYFFRYDDREGVLIKIGQLPSIEDVAGSDIERFRGILGADFSELRRATGLFAHGIGIGSFVYLRRIFERLIDEAREAAGLDSNEFGQKRMTEKVEALASALPAAVVRYKAAYSILSKGIHELTEDECKRLFPTIRASIIMMLEERYEAAQKKKAADDLEREFRSIESSLGR